MLGTMEPLLLRACICGTVGALAERHGSVVRKELLSIAEREVTPGTYANFFTDRSGMALTPAQLRVVLEGMKRYLNLKASSPDLIWIWKIDRLHFPKKNWLRANVDGGLRRYTDWKPNDPKHPNRPFKRDERRRAVLFHFIKEVERVISSYETAGRLHVPCVRPLTEVGYAKRPCHRLEKHHAKHVNSNYIMNLFHAVMMASLGRDFRLQQVILYSCWRSGQAWLSEIVLTRILQAYTDGGKGLSHYQAGLSNWSANRYVGDEVWHRVVKEINLERRLSASYEEEIADTKQRRQDLEKAHPGPIPKLLQGEMGEAISTQLQVLLRCLEDEDDDGGSA